MRALKLLPIVNCLCYPDMLSRLSSMVQILTARPASLTAAPAPVTSTAALRSLSAASGATSATTTASPPTRLWWPAGRSATTAALPSASGGPLHVRSTRCAAEHMACSFHTVASTPVDTRQCWSSVPCVRFKMQGRGVPLHQLVGTALRATHYCLFTVLTCSYKRVKGRSHTVEKRKAIHPQKPHATSC